jgi:hypothetical protein
MSINLISQNIFSALDQSKKKKKASKAKDASRDERKSKEEKHAELEKAIFSAPTAVASNWADESEDEYEAHPEPQGDGWNQVCAAAARCSIACLHALAPPHYSHIIISARSHLEIQAKGGYAPVVNASAARPIATPSIAATETESEDDEDEHVDIEAELGIEVARSDDEEEEEEQVPEAVGAAAAAAAAPATGTAAALDPGAARAPQPQLSKKELKKKELEDLNAVLAELGLSGGEAVAKGEAEDVAGGGTAGAKAAKRKQKKERAVTTTNGDVPRSAATAVQEQPEQQQQEEQENQVGPSALRSGLLHALAMLINGHRYVLWFMQDTPLTPSFFSKHICALKYRGNLTPALCLPAGGRHQ